MTIMNRKYINIILNTENSCLLKNFKKYSNKIRKMKSNIKYCKSLKKLLKYLRTSYNRDSNLLLIF